MRLADLLWLTGRIGRMRYWQWVLFLVLAMSINMIIGYGAIMFVGSLGAVLLAPMLAILAGNVSIMIQRLHDRNKTGWWLIPFVVLPVGLSGWASEADPGMTSPMSVSVVLLGLVLQLWGLVEIGFRSGTPGPNRFGPDPLAPSNEAVFA
jgi:uncharacterized membrane protein YhaH (DUF805 family)